MTLTKIFDFRILDYKTGMFISFPSPEKGEAEYLQLGFRILLVLSVVCISNEKLTKQLCKVGLQGGKKKCEVLVSITILLPLPLSQVRLQELALQPSNYRELSCWATARHTDISRIIQKS